MLRHMVYVYLEETLYNADGIAAKQESFYPHWSWLFRTFKEQF